MKARRQWRKLHIAIDAATGEIIAEVLTDQDTSDVSQLETLLDQIDDRIDRFIADGAYDGQPTYVAIQQHSPSARIIILPRSTCLPKDIYGPSIQREAHVTSLAEAGRMLWQARNDYGKRSCIETTMGRYKRGSGNRLNARTFINQQAEASRRCSIQNRQLSCARPDSVRVKAATA